MGKAGALSGLRSVAAAFSSTLDCAMSFEDLPGGELVTAGLADLASGRETVEALLVAIGSPRLRRAGIEVPPHGIEAPEHRLYARLEADDEASAHSRYNAFIRRLVSFERALECVGR